MAYQGHPWSPKTDHCKAQCCVDTSSSGPKNECLSGEYEQHGAGFTNSKAIGDVKTGMTISLWAKPTSPGSYNEIFGMANGWVFVGTSVD